MSAMSPMPPPGSLPRPRRRPSPLPGPKRMLVRGPGGLARPRAAILGLLPQPPLTTDQVKLLERDNVASGTLPGLADLGITPDGPEAILPAYLDRFRPGGRFARA